MIGTIGISDPDTDDLMVVERLVIIAKQSNRPSKFTRVISETLSRLAKFNVQNAEAREDNHSRG